MSSSAPLGSLTQLERLSLESTTLGRNESPGFLVGLTKLKSLTLNVNDDESREWLRAVGKLPDLERLELRGWGGFSSEDLTHLSGSRNLKTLSVDTFSFDGFESRETRTCLAAVGKLTQLERLHLELFRVDDLAYLKDLTNLRLLTLWCVGGGPEDDWYDRDPLARLPALPRLEALRVGLLQTTANDIERLAALPRLKSLDLVNSWQSGAALPNWARLESLERLAVLRDTITVEFLESLATVKHLKEIRISPYPDTSDQAELSLDHGHKLRYSAGEIDGLRRALAALRRSHPELVVVNHEAERATDEFEENEKSAGPWPFDSGQAIDRGESFMRQFALPLPGP